MFGCADSFGSSIFGDIGRDAYGFSCSANMKVAT